MTDLDDLELRHRFASLRAAEQARAPGFAETLDRARQHRRRPGPSAPLLVIGAASMTVLVLCFGHARREPVSIDAITAWRPATDAFLPVRSASLYGPLPPLGASVVDSLIR